MAKMLTVKAGPNGRVPLPAPIQGKSWIEDEPVTVESSRFFRRRIEAGDLVLIEDDDEKTDADTLTPETVGTVAEVVTSANPPTRATRRATTPPERKE